MRARPLRATDTRVSLMPERRDAETRFRRAYLDNHRAILAYALRRGVEHASAEEIVAETFAVLWRRMNDAQDPDSLLPWLYGVAARILANQRRGAARRERLSKRLQALAPRHHEDESRALERLEVGAVIDALGHLSAGEQEVLLLAAWEGLSHREIASVLGCSENAAAIRLHRARRHLAELCGKEAAGSRHNDDESTSRKGGSREETR